MSLVSVVSLWAWLRLVGAALDSSSRPLDRGSAEQLDLRLQTMVGRVLAQSH